jgi:hypothetical protein
MAPNTEREEPIVVDEQLDLGKLAREKGAYMVYPDVKVSERAFFAKRLTLQSSVVSSSCSL